MGKRPSLLPRVTQHFPSSCCDYGVASRCSPVCNMDKEKVSFENREKVSREWEGWRRLHCPDWGQEVTNSILSQTFRGSPRPLMICYPACVCACCFKRCGSHPAVHAGSSTHDWNINSQQACWLVCLDTWYYVITCMKPIMWKKSYVHRLKRDCQTRHRGVALTLLPLFSIVLCICLHAATCYTTC